MTIPSERGTGAEDRSSYHGTMAHRVVLLNGLLAAILVACSTGAGVSPSDARVSPGAQASEASSPTAGSSSALSAAVPADVLDPLLDDAASRTGATRDTITVVDAAAVAWPTGALGCPRPGVMYTQALVRGWRVVLLAAGTRIDYRASAPGRFRVCEGIVGG